jgi:hypothetical protein
MRSSYYDIPYGSAQTAVEIGGKCRLQLAGVENPEWTVG